MRHIFSVTKRCGNDTQNSWSFDTCWYVFIFTNIDKSRQHKLRQQVCKKIVRSSAVAETSNKPKFMANDGLSTSSRINGRLCGCLRKQHRSKLENEIVSLSCTSTCGQYFLNTILPRHHLYHHIKGAVRWQCTQMNSLVNFAINHQLQAGAVVKSLPIFHQIFHQNASVDQNRSACRYFSNVIVKGENRDILCAFIYTTNKDKTPFPPNRHWTFKIQCASTFHMYITTRARRLPYTHD